jgi:hypothetical protein
MEREFDTANSYKCKAAAMERVNRCAGDIYSEVLEAGSSAMRCTLFGNANDVFASADRAQN